MKQLDRHYGKLDKERDRQKKQTTKHQTIINDLGTKHTINNQENQDINEAADKINTEYPSLFMHKVKINWLTDITT